MMRPIFRFAFTLVAVIFLTISNEAQPLNTNAPTDKETTSKPFRILTSGKLVTIKSGKTIKSVMVWTSGGNRIVEDKNVNASSYNFRVTATEKIFFVMVKLADGKTYSEKIGVQ